METSKQRRKKGRDSAGRARNFGLSVALDAAKARDIGIRVASNLSRAWNSLEVKRTGPIRVLDMFSGCGGMSAGFKALNAEVPFFDLLGAVDIDEVANRTYKSNLAISPSRIDISSLVRSRRQMDAFFSHLGIHQAGPTILIGCAPCQGFSSHRNADGEQDTRNTLFLDFVRLAEELSPDAVVVENVPELLTDRYWPFVSQARRVLERRGYFVHIGVHNMAEFGVPQERFRALFLAMKRPFAPPKGFLDRGQFKTVKDAIGALPKVKAGQRHPNDPMHFSAAHKQSTIDTIRAVPKDGGSRPEHVGPECLRRAKVKNGKAAYEDVYGRLYWSRPSITITAFARNPASGRFVHPEQNRGLTIREAALLQSFPKDFTFEGSLDDCFRQIGNAVPPAFSAYLAAHIVGQMTDQPALPHTFDKGFTAPVGSSFSRMIPSLKSASSR